MAEAYGKLTGQPGVCLVTRGPGATHAAVGVHTARHDSTPMLLLIGQVARAHRGREAFQEVEFTAMFEPLAKAAAEIDDATRVPERVAWAHAEALAPRRGPVVLSLPEDMLAEEVEADLVEAMGSGEEPGPTALEVERAVALLAAAERPMIMVGGSVWDARAARALADWAEACGIPVVTTFRRQDYVDNTSDAYVGYAGIAVDPALAERIAAADVLLALGTRLADASTGSYTLIRGAAPQTAAHSRLPGCSGARPRLRARAFDRLWSARLHPRTLRAATVWYEHRSHVGAGDARGVRGRTRPEARGGRARHGRRCDPPGGESAPPTRS